MLVFRLALRALRWRGAASATVFAVAVIGILTATTGPIYLSAANQKVLGERLGEASQFRRDIYISRPTLLGMPAVRWSDPVRAFADEIADPRWYTPPVFAEQADIYYDAGTRSVSRLAAVDGLCAHLTFVRGRCVGANATGETVISARTAQAEHIVLGELVRPQPVANAEPVPLRVVGVYQPIDPLGPFWESWNFFDAQPAVSDRSLPRIDSFLVSPAALEARLATTGQTLAASVRLVPSRVRLDDLPALRASLAHLQAAVTDRNRREGQTDTTVRTELPAVLDGMSREMSLTRQLVTVSTVQLTVLAMLVLYAVVAGTTSVQAPEVALAKLRGRRARSVLLQGVLQPVVLVLVAAPVAAALAWLVVRLAAGSLLGTDADVSFPLPAVGIAALATGGGILAAAVAARRVIFAPVSALLRRGADRSGSSFGLALADAAVVALAVAGFVELIANGVLASGRVDPLSALAPSLVAVATSVLVLRIVPLAGRGLVRWTRESPRLAPFLTIRQIVRRPAGARVLLLVAVALAIATFAVTNWSVASTNRQARALNSTGAATVLDVTPGPAVDDLRTAVDRADPSDHSLAVAFVSGDQSIPLVAVDTRRFAGVGAWTSDDTPEPLAQVLAEIGRPRPPSVVLTGTLMRLTVDLSRRPRAAVDLTVQLTSHDHEVATYDFGALQSGRGTYERAVAPSCALGCRVTALSLSANTPDETAIVPGAGLAELDATIAAAAFTGRAWQPVAGFDDPTRWRGDGEGAAWIRHAAASLSVVLRQTIEGGGWASLLSADVPAHLAAVLSSGVAASYPGPRAHDVAALGLDGNVLSLDGAIRSVTLPEVDRGGVMVDLGAALTAMAASPAPQTQFQVWAGSGAPHDLAARLARQGVRVTRRLSVARARSALDRSGPAFAAGLSLIAAAAAAVLAMGAAVVSGLLTARRRAYELAALRTAGVRVRTLRRSVAGEQAVVLGSGLVVGVAAGLGGARLALPSTPFFVETGVGPPILHGLPWPLLSILVAMVAFAFALICVIIALVVARQAGIDRLREGQQ